MSRLIEVRKLLSQLFEADDEFIKKSEADIIAFLRKKYVDILENARFDLENSTLSRLITEAGRLKSRARDKKTTIEYFGDRTGIPKFIKIRIGPRKWEKKYTHEAQPAELEAWLEGHVKKTSKTRNDNVKKMLDELQPYILAGAKTIGDAIIASKTQRQ